ncbi:MAG: GNAT family N-acetyltransferase [Trueperaceae bacterium]|nr:GNAT family N-acetyltransferase [Trueperaceae bacterium]
MPEAAAITVLPVDASNWREVAGLKVKRKQRAFVAEPSYYLSLCAYSQWNPLAVYLETAVIGFMMWAKDDDSHWLGGILLDKRFQGKGFGRLAVLATLDYLRASQGARSFALSYQADNLTAKQLYMSLGFTETGEVEDNEVVARLK